MKPDLLLSARYGLDTLEQTIASSPLGDLPALAGELARLQAVLTLRLAQPIVPIPDSVLCLREAAKLLGMTEAWLQRRANWGKVGGYRDADSRIKFSRATLEAWLRAKGQG
jgi:hypothetical protein